MTPQAAADDDDGNGTSICLEITTVERSAQERSPYSPHILARHIPTTEIKPLVVAPDPSALVVTSSPMQAVAAVAREEGASELDNGSEQGTLVASNARRVVKWPQERPFATTATTAITTTTDAVPRPSWIPAAAVVATAAAAEAAAAEAAASTSPCPLVPNHRQRPGGAGGEGEEDEEEGKYGELLLQRWRALFGKVDRNGDGQLTRVELLSAVRSSPALATELNSLFGLPEHIRQEDGTRDVRAWLTDALPP